jgi:tetratricopeptide (TPR) repeat protein
MHYQILLSEVDIIKTAIKLFDDKKYYDGIDECDKIIEANPTNLFPLLLKAEIFLTRKSYDSAINNINKILSGSPEHDEDTIIDITLHTYFLKGLVLLKMKRFEDAILSFDNVLEINEMDELAYDNKAFALACLGKNNEALKFNDKAMKINSSNPIIFVNLSHTLGNLGKFEEALDACESAIKLDPNYAKAWNNKAYALFRKGEIEEAEKCSHKSLDIDPNDVDALDTMMQILKKLGRDEESKKYHDRIVDFDKNYFESEQEIMNRVEKENEEISNLVKTADENIGIHFDKAEDSYREALKLAKSSEYHTNLIFNKLAELYEGTNEMDEKAAEMYEKCENGQKAGQLYEKCENYLKAAEMYGENSRKTPEMWSKAGEYLKAAEMYDHDFGDYKNAAEMYKNAGNEELYKKMLNQEDERNSLQKE